MTQNVLKMVKYSLKMLQEIFLQDYYSLIILWTRGVTRIKKSSRHLFVSSGALLYLVDFVLSYLIEFFYDVVFFGFVVM